MEIIRLSENSFKIKGKLAVVVVDFSDKKTTVGDFSVDSPGEYEIAGVTVFGAINFHKIKIDGVDVCCLFADGNKLEQDQLDLIGNVDILLVLKKADEIVTQLEPLVIVTLEKSGTIDSQAKFVITKDKLPETTTYVHLS